MSSSFISYESDKGFWINDSLFEVACSFIVQGISKLDVAEEWLSEFKDLIQNNSKGLYPGFMHLNLRDFLINKSREDLFISILEDVQQGLILKGEWVGIDELNSFIVYKNLQSEWVEPLQTKLIFNIISNLIKLIKGDINTDAGDPPNSASI